MSSARFDVTGLISDAGRLQEELCARIPESEKRNLRIALGLEHDEVTLHMQKKRESVLNLWQEEDLEDPFAPKNRNILKEYWDEFMGSIYSWYYSIGGAAPGEATRTRRN